jgi:hypothetical protein
MKFMSLLIEPRFKFSGMVRAAGLGRAGVVFWAGVTFAEVPEPDTVIHSKVQHRFGEALTAAAPGQLSVVAKVEGTALAEYLLPPGTDAYLLRIPMDDGREPRHPHTARSGDRVRFFIRNHASQRDHECVESHAAPWLLPQERAPLAALDLSVEANVAGAATDTEGDGLPDYWEHHYGLDPLRPSAGEDADGDGMSDRDEFRAGTNPRSADSKLLIALEQRSGAQPDLRLTIRPALSDRTYSVRVSSSIHGGWTEQVAVRPPVTGELTVPSTGPPAPAPVFFRVAVVP